MRTFSSLLAASLLFALFDASAGGNTCTTIASGNWSNAAIWDCGGGSTPPQVGDSAIIENGHTVTLDVDVSVNDLTVAAGGDFDVAASAMGLALNLTATNADSSDLSNASTDLAGDLTINGGQTHSISVGAVDGAHQLTVSGDGIIFLSGEIGGTTPLASLTTIGTSDTLLQANVTTTGVQTYREGQIRLYASLGLTGSEIIFNAPVNCEVGSNFDLTITGNATFNADSIDQELRRGMGEYPPLQSLSISGTTTLAAPGGTEIGTVGLQNYMGAIVMSSDTTLTRYSTGAIDLGSISGAFHLTVNSSGLVAFNASTGQPSPVSITTDAGGITRFGGGERIITVNGSQPTTFGDTFQLSASSRVTINQQGSGDVVFDGNVETASGSPHRLTVNDVSGSTIFNGTVLAGQLTTNDGTGADKTVFNGGMVILDQGGADNGVLTLNDPVEISQDTTFQELDAGQLLFMNTLDAASGVMDAELTLLSDNQVVLSGVGTINPTLDLYSDPGGSVLINGDIETIINQFFNDDVVLGGPAIFSGLDGTFIAGFDAQGNDLTFDYSAPFDFPGLASFSNLGNLTLGPPALRTPEGGSAINLTGDVTVTGSLNLQVPAQVQTDVALTAAHIGIHDTLDADAVGNNRTVTLTTTASGTTVLEGMIGNSEPLLSLTTNADGTTELASQVTTQGGSVTFNNPLVITGNSGFANQGGTGATLTFAAAVECETGGTCNNSLTLNPGAGGLVDVQSSVGAIQPLGALSASSGTLQVGAQVTTVGDQVYAAPIVLTGDTVFTSLTGDVEFGGTVNGGFMLTAMVSDPAGEARFLAAAGGNSPLTGLMVGGAGTALLDLNFDTIHLNSSVGATFAVPVILAQGAVNTIEEVGPGDISFLSSISLEGTGGLSALALNDISGTTRLMGPVDVSTLFTNDGAGDDRTLIAASTMHTRVAGGFSGNVTINDPIEIGGDMLFSAGLSSFYNFGQSVNDDGDTGTPSNVTFDFDFPSIAGSVGDASPLDSLTSTGGFYSQGDVFTLGPQLYQDIFYPGANTVLSGTSIEFQGEVLGFTTRGSPTGSLTVDTSVMATFGGPVGMTTPLVSLQTQGSGTDLINGSQVTAQNLVSFGNPVMLGMSTSINADQVSFSDAVELGSGDLSVSTQTSGNAAAAISGSGGLSKSGPGSLDLQGSNSYSGDTTISAGNLILTGATDAASAVSVDGGVLSGDGTAAGPVNAMGGDISPGTSPGVLATGTLMVDASSALILEVNGIVPGSEHDQVMVTGTVTLNSAVLDLSGTFTPSGTGTQLILIDNDGGDAVIGTFAGLPEGGFVSLNGLVRISYAGGDGNDVTLIDDETPFADGFEGGP